MATNLSERKSYPYIPAKNWFSLRNNFKRSMPRGEVDANYLSTTLNISDKQARGTITDLKVVGILGEDGRVSELADRWRHDDDYADVCQSIIDDVYPQSLLDAFGDEDLSSAREKIQRWFMKDTRLGEVSARQFASFYILLASKDLSKAEEAPKASSGGSKRQIGNQRKARIQPQIVEGVINASENTSKNDVNGESPPEMISQGDRLDNQKNLTLHIDLQIHISPDSSSEQIDKIFSSISKYIYDRKVDG